MNFFMLVLADHSEPKLRERCESFLASLRSNFPKALAIQPHILLFQCPKGVHDAFSLLPTELRQGGQALLFQVQPDFSGFGMTARVDELKSFFRVVDP